MTDQPNEPVTPENATTPDGMTPPSPEEAERQKSYAQVRGEHAPTPEEEEAEKARVAAQPRLVGGHLSVGMQPQPVPTHKSASPPPLPAGEEAPPPGEPHLEDMTLLPKFSADDARKLNGGEGYQFKVDAVKMVEAETARVAQLHDIVGQGSIVLGCDGLETDPPNDFSALDEALAAAQAQVEAGKDDGDSDVKEIALVSTALMQTARYWAIELPSGPKEAPAPAQPTMSWDTTQPASPPDVTRYDPNAPTP